MALEALEQEPSQPLLVGQGAEPALGAGLLELPLLGGASFLEPLEAPFAPADRLESLAVPLQVDASWKNFTIE